MLITESDLYSKLRKHILKNAINSSWITQKAKEINKKYGYSINDIYPFLTCHLDIELANENMLWCFVSELMGDEIKNIYTPTEIEYFKNIQNKVTEEIRNINLCALKISDRHFITTISARTLLNWKNNNLIKYNEATQRPLQQKTKNGFTYWQNDVNSKSVQSIKKLFLNNDFIPNTITLNIEEGNGELEYNDKNYTLKISDLVCFDIIDGYHRYLAMFHALSENPDWDYQIELRIFNFSEQKARQFIWQENQKNKMKKVDSDSMNQHNQANQVADMIKEKMPNKIIGEIIKYSDIAKAIDFCFIDNKTKYKTSDLLNLRNDICDKLNELLDMNPDIFDNIWSPIQTQCCMILIKLDCLNVDNLNLSVNECKIANCKSYTKTLNKIREVITYV